MDLEVRAAYVEYAPGASVKTVDLNETSSVVRDLDASGSIVGIGVLEVHLAWQIDNACEFAQAHDLVFPSDSTSNLVPA